MLTTDAIAKAVGEVKGKSEKRKFVQSLDLAINLNLDMSKPENRLNEEFSLPNGRGKPVKVGVIAEGELALQAKKVADLVITREDLEELAKNKKAAKKIVEEHDFFIAQTDLMPLIGRYLGTVMGPRGKMPKPIPVNAPIAPAVERLKRTVRIRTKEKPVLHVCVGTEDMEDKKLIENIEAVLKFLERKLEKGFTSINSVYLKTTMGPSVKIGV
ncbi:MAG: 50S ribosomal protein L1 [Methanobacteriota archaeon]